jgi:ABC-type multidrug transport system fused ATPase/permease subunit
MSGTRGEVLTRRSRGLLGELLRAQRRAFVIVGVLVVLDTAAGLAIPLLVGRGIDHGVHAVGTGDASAVWRTVAILVGIVLLQGIAHYQFLITSGRATQDVLFRIRTRVFNHVQRLSIGFLEKYTSGRVIARLTSDVDAISELLSTGVVDVVTNLLFLLGTIVILLRLDVPLALVTFAVIPAVLALARWFSRRAHETFKWVRRSVANLIVQITESLGGIRAVQAFRGEERNDVALAERNLDYTTANVESIRLISILAPALNLLGRGVTAAVLVVGAFRVQSGALSIGVLVAFVIYVRQFFEPLNELTQVYNLLHSATAALENLADLLDERPGVPPPVQPVELPYAVGEVRFEQVRFAYGDETVLHHLDLEIPAGQTVALVGATGAGKTTLARLVARLWDPTEGRVLLDGVDLRQLDDATLRRHVAMVTQESFLFTGSIADNVRFGKPGANDEEVRDALTAVGASAFVDAMPEGINTDVRARGARLSSGQRQLVAFARAFLADPAVLILDEATSSLDVPSEQLVQEALQRLLANRTAIIIAHRLSTVTIADRVLVLDGGRVVEDGTSQELIACGGAYAHLHETWAASPVD